MEHTAKLANFKCLFLDSRFELNISGPNLLYFKMLIVNCVKWDLLFDHINIVVIILH